MRVCKQCFDEYTQGKGGSRTPPTPLKSEGGVEEDNLLPEKKVPPLDISKDVKEPAPSPRVSPRGSVKEAAITINKLDLPKEPPKESPKESPRESSKESPAESPQVSSKEPHRELPKLPSKPQSEAPAPVQSNSEKQNGTSSMIRFMCSS